MRNKYGEIMKLRSINYTLREVSTIIGAIAEVHDRPHEMWIISVYPSVLLKAREKYENQII